MVRLKLKNGWRLSLLGFYLAVKDERRGPPVWVELKVKEIKKRGANANPMPREGVGEKR